MGHLGNHLLNAADFHSTERGYGIRYLTTINRTWVLSRLVIELSSTPQAYDEFYVATWVSNVMRTFTHRDFAIQSLSGDITYGYGQSIWAMIDTVTRQPVDIVSINDGLINKYIEPDEPCPIEKFRRARFASSPTLVSEVTTGYTDVDINGHINSVKYIEHMLNAVPVEYHRRNQLSRIDIAYTAECHGADHIRIYTETTSPQDFTVSLRRVNPDDSETEACSARMHFVPR